MKKPFHETTWSKVKACDVVLFAWPERRKYRDPRIVKVEVKECALKLLDDKTVAVVWFIHDGLNYGRSFNPDETVYVQSRL